MRRSPTFLAVLIVLCTAVAVQAETVTFDMVAVGDPGNPADTVAFNAGSVSYTYKMSKYEVTAGQYVEFLNAKAADDPYGLYNSAMATGNTPCGIVRDGTAGSYTYSLSNANWTNRPVNYVDFWDCIRFANWLHNGQGAGDTETGSYTITADGIANNTVARNPGATYVIPTNDEWHKAAYYDAAQSYYYDYATSSDTPPLADVVDPDPGNNAAVFDGARTAGIAVVGEFENSESPYGTFDQTGNVREWTESSDWQPGRIIRDGQWNWWNTAASSSTLLQFYPNAVAANDQGLGFRVAMVPEPGIVALSLIAGLCVLSRRKR